METFPDVNVGDERNTFKIILLMCTLSLHATGNYFR